MKRLPYYSVELILIAILGAAVAYFGYLLYGLLDPAYAMEPFSGERARFYTAHQIELGDRIVGSEGGILAGDWLTSELSTMGWDVVVQSFVAGDSTMARNIIAQKGEGPDAGPVVILSTHYDTRALADLDPDEEKRTQSTPGANAGASGTAVLLELARTLDADATGHTVCLVFLDGEDNGGLTGWDYAMGSDAFLKRIETDTPRCMSPRAAIYLDMVGGLNARIAAIGPEAPELVDSLKDVADGIGYSNAFQGPHIRDETDALTRFSQAGIPALTLAETDYDHRHTTDDTLDKISSFTLQYVGDVLKAWLESRAPM